MSSALTIGREKLLTSKQTRKTTINEYSRLVQSDLAIRYQTSETSTEKSAFKFIIDKVLPGWIAQGRDLSLVPDAIRNAQQEASWRQRGNELTIVAADITENGVQAEFSTVLKDTAKKTATDIQKKAKSLGRAMFSPWPYVITGGFALLVVYGMYKPRKV